MAEPTTTTAAPAPARGPSFQEIGTTGLNQWGGYIREEFIRELIGRRGKALLREMAENDSVVGASLYAIEYFARQATWRFESEQSPEDRAAGKEDARGKELADTLDGMLFKDMNQPWGDTVAEILSMLVYGFSLFEIVYKRRLGGTPDVAVSPADKAGTTSTQQPATSLFKDGLIGWRKFAPRSQDTIERWGFDETGELMGAYQQPIGSMGLFNTKMQTPGLWFLPVEVVLLFRTSTRKGNPEGRSILRSAFRDWQMKRRIQEIEGMGVERDLAGMPVLTAPEHLDIWNPQNPAAVALLNAAKKLVTSIRRDAHEGIVLPFNWKLELLGSNSKRQFDTNAVITRYDQRIAMTMLADFILVGHDAVGSKALNQTKLRGFTLAMTSFLDHIADVINRVAVPRLAALNGWPLENLPKLKHDEIEEIDLQKLGEFLKAVSVAGMPLFPEPMLQKYLLGAAKLPVPPDDMLPTVPLPVEEPFGEDDPAADDEDAPPADAPRPRKRARPGA